MTTDRRTVLLTDDHEVFAERAAALLRDDPIGTNVPATVLAAVRAGHAQPPGSLWAVVGDGDRPSGIGLWTAGYPPYLTPMPQADAAALAEAAHRAGRTVTMVRGDADAAAGFARRWADLAGVAARQVTAEGVHLLGDLVPPSGVPGSSRTATAEDADVVGAWYQAFEREAHPAGEPLDDATLAERAASLVARMPDQPVVLWTVDDRPVSLARWQVPDAVPDASGKGTGDLRIGRIGPVYTPPEHRRRGYAAAVTAAASRAALDGGAARVMLYTDLANPTSNGVYARLGYRRIGDCATWALTTPSPPQPTSP